MPGPVSDSYDPEWGTEENADDIREALQGMYDWLTQILINATPQYILDVVHAPEWDMSTSLPASLREREWRLLRFALERAMQSL